MPLAVISNAQFIGSLVETALLVAAAAYVLWLRPQSIGRSVRAGQLTRMQGEEKLRKPNPKIGYLIFIAAACQLAVALMQWFS